MRWLDRSVFRRGNTSSLYLTRVAVLVVGVIALIALIRQVDTPPAEPFSSPNLSSRLSEPASSSTTDGWVELGGVSRPATDVRLANSSSRIALTQEKPRVSHGFSPPVDPNSNANTKAVFAALKSRESPSHFSSFATADPFDRAAYERDPQAYIDIVEPSRVFSPAEPGEGIKPIRSNGKRLHRVTQGETVRLSVFADPGAPVTFTSQALGYFDNLLTSQTVKANGDGVAEANFTAGGGTVDIVPILAASPVNSGQITFNVSVRLKAASTR